MRQRSVDRRGASAVEFALCLPWVLLCIVGTTDFAMWAQTHHAVARAVQDGARHGSMIVIPDGSNDGGPIESAAEEATLEAMRLWGANIAGASINAEWDADGEAMMWLSVTATVPYQSLFGVSSPLQRPVVRTFSVVTQEQINN